MEPSQTIEGADQHHCADHARFQPDCAVCKRACANFQPYPVRKTAPVARSFGFKDDLTAEKLRALDPKMTDLYADETDFSLSLSTLRFIRRLIWPF